MRRENEKSSDVIDDTEGVEEGSFFGRWSRRKRRARRERVEETPVQAPVEETKPDPDKSVSAPERVLTDEDMPPLESLNEDSDYSGFMSPGVSESLRKLALRKMFLSSKYNFTDGLDDYAEDFTRFAPLGSTVTYDMRRQMETEAERAKQKLEQEARAAMQEEPADEGVETVASTAGVSKGDAVERDTEGPAQAETQTGEFVGDSSSGDDSASS